MGYDNFVPAKTIMKILFCSITYGKNIFAGMENAANRMHFGAKERCKNIARFLNKSQFKES